MRNFADLHGTPGLEGLYMKLVQTSIYSYDGPHDLYHTPMTTSTLRSYLPLRPALISHDLPRIPGSKQRSVTGPACYTFPFFWSYLSMAISKTVNRIMPSAENVPARHDSEKMSRRLKLSESEDPDAEFGGTEARKILERKLLWKVDLRMSILVFIYILNYVRVLSFPFLGCVFLTNLTSDRQKQCWV